VTLPLFLATIALTVVAAVQRRQYAWLWATLGIGGLGIILPDILGPVIQSAVENSLSACEDQHGSIGCPQSAGQTLLVNGMQDLLLLGLLLIVLLAVVYSFRMRKVPPVPTSTMLTPTPD
jgi:formate hydrogenlyase subunit 3/multisubunit Na+/H+ antiporter MnhD subunit